MGFSSAVSLVHDAVVEDVASANSTVIEGPIEEGIARALDLRPLVLHGQ